MRDALSPIHRHVSKKKGTAAACDANRPVPNPVVFSLQAFPYGAIVTAHSTLMPALNPDM